MRTRAAVWLIMLAATAVVTLALATAAFASPPVPKKEKPTSVGKPAHVTWTPRVVSGTIAAGETLTATVTFTLTRPITNPVFVVVPRHRVEVDTSGVPTETLAANTPYTITITASPPEEYKGARFNAVVKLKEQGSRRMLSSPLPVRIRVERGAEAQED